MSTVCWPRIGLFRTAAIQTTSGVRRRSVRDIGKITTTKLLTWHPPVVPSIDRITTYRWDIPKPVPGLTKMDLWATVLAYCDHDCIVILTVRHDDLCQLTISPKLKHLVGWTSGLTSCELIIRKLNRQTKWYDAFQERSFVVCFQMQISSGHNNRWQFRLWQACVRLFIFYCRKSHWMATLFARH